jgi:hypothetical protein
MQAGAPFGFLNGGKGWNRHVSPPWTGIILLLRHWHDPNRPDAGMPMDLVAVLVFVALAVLAFRSPWPAEFRAFLVLAVALPLCIGHLQSGMRYMEAAWPGFAVAADRLVDHELVVTAMIVIALVFLNAYTLHVWSGGQFVG